MAAIQLTSLQAQIASAADQYRTSLSKPIVVLQQQRAAAVSRSTVFNTLRTKMKALQTAAAAINKTDATSKFLVYSGTSSNAAVASATATSGQAIGAHTLLVTQLAKNDSLVSSRIISANTDITTAQGIGVKQFSVTVNGTAVSISVTLDGTETNSALLTKISTAINASSTVGVSAAVLTDTATTSKLVLSSKSTGSNNAITLADVTGTLMNGVGISSAVVSGRTAATATTAGYMYSATTSLDANVTLDGIALVKTSNTITDALSGVTISLSGTQLGTDVPVTLNVGLDKTAISANVKTYLDAYNAVIAEVQKQTKVDAVAKTRQPLAGDPTYVGLRSSLRSLMASQVSSVTSGNPDYLSTIGITADAAGALSISDTTKFNDAITTTSTKVSDLFNSTSGLAVQMKTVMDNFVKSGGVLDGNLAATQSRIRNTDKTGYALQARIDKKVEQFQRDLANAQVMLSKLSAQSQSVGLYASQVGSGAFG